MTAIQGFPSKTLSRESKQLSNFSPVSFVYDHTTGKVPVLVHRFSCALCCVCEIFAFFGPSSSQYSQKCLLRSLSVKSSWGSLWKSEGGIEQSTLDRFHLSERQYGGPKGKECDVPNTWTSRAWWYEGGNSERDSRFYSAFLRSGKQCFSVGTGTPRWCRCKFLNVSIMGLRSYVEDEEVRFVLSEYG